MQHDRRHDLNAEQGGAAGEDRSGERDPRLSARSLAARGEAPDASEDGEPQGGEPADESGNA
jgi:hypothetical protein